MLGASVAAAGFEWNENPATATDAQSIASVYRYS